MRPVRRSHNRAAALYSLLLLPSIAQPIFSERAAANPFVVFEPASGRVLDYEDLDRYWHPASLTKLMTAYLTLEAIKAGRLEPGAKLELSAYARSQPPTRIGLKPGIDVTIEQGVRALIMRSANDFAVALAEAVAGSEPAFVERMNATAARLGMTRTHYVNPHGLPEPEQVTTARDLALLASALLRDFPERADVFSAPQMAMGKATLHTLNDLLRTLPGADGMKTGFTCSSGYNVVASASRSERRVIAVLLGEVSSTERSLRAAQLLNAAFETHAGAPPGVGSGVPLSDIPLPPMEAVPAEDLTHVTRTWKCGNGGGAPRQPIVVAHHAQKHRARR